MPPRGRPKSENSRRALAEKRKQAELEALEAKIRAEKDAEMQARLTEIAEKEAENARLLAEKDAEIQRQLAEIQAREDALKQAKTPMDTELPIFGEEETEKDADFRQEEPKSGEELTENTGNFGEDDAENEPNFGEEHTENSDEDEDDEDYTFDLDDFDLDDEEDDDEEEPSLEAQIGKRTETKNASERAPIAEPASDDERFEVPLGSKFKIEDNGAPDSVEAMMDADEGAMFLISSLNTFQSWLLPRIADNDFFTRSERRRLRQMLEMKGKVELNEADFDLLEKSKDYDEYCNQVPLKPEEIQNLHTPLKKMMVGRGITVSPGFAFIMALVLVMAPRLWPIFSMKMENRKKQAAEERRRSARAEEPPVADAKEEASDEPEG